MSYRHDNEEFAANQDGEAIAQAHLDRYWQSRGVTVDRTKACKSFDAIYGWHQRQRTAEEKFRNIARTENDILLEIVQDLVKPDYGWFVKTPADRLFYVLCDERWHPLIIYSLEWAKFRTWYLKEYLPKHKSGNYVVSTKGFGLMINFVLKLKDIPLHLYKKIDLSVSTY